MAFKEINSYALGQLEKLAKEKKVTGDTLCVICSRSGKFFLGMSSAEAGDRLLVRAVEDLKEYFGEEQIYRTGSDEFVVAVKSVSGIPTEKEFVDKVNIVFRQMLVAEKLDDGRAIYPKYKAAIIKMNGNIDLSVVTILKDMTNKTGEATVGMIELRDMT